MTPHGGGGGHGKPGQGTGGGHTGGSGKTLSRALDPAMHAPAGEQSTATTSAPLGAVVGQKLCARNAAAASRRSAGRSLRMGSVRKAMMNRPARRGKGEHVPRRAARTEGIGVT